MNANGSSPTFTIDDLKQVTIPQPILVAGYQADTSNSIEYNAAPGESPIAKVIHQMMEQPLDVRMLQPHPAGQMASAYTHFTNLDSQDPLYKYTMGMRVAAGDELPVDVGMVEVPGGEFLSLEVPGPFHSTIPAAWSWLLNQFADGTIPYRRTFAGDVELYTFGPGEDDSVCVIYVAVEGVG